VKKEHASCYFKIKSKKKKGERPRNVSIKPKTDRVAARAHLFMCCHAIR